MASTEGTAPITVRGGRPSDAEVAASLHASQIGEGFLASLGTKFLTRLYRRIVATPTSFLLVAADGDGVVGFIAGSTDVGGLYKRFILRDGAAAFLESAPRLLGSWRHALETLRHGSSGIGTGRGAELLSIAVSPTAQGRGVGRALVAAHLHEVVDRGGDASYVVVGADNAPAVALYRAAGFVTGAEIELHPGTTSLLMQWDADVDA